MKFETPVRVNAEDVKRLSKGLHEWFVKRYGETAKVSIHMVAWGSFLEVNAPAVAEFIKAYAIETLRCEDAGKHEASLQALNMIASTLGMGSEFHSDLVENLEICNDSASFCVYGQRVNLDANGCVIQLHGHTSTLMLADGVYNIIVLSGDNQEFVAPKACDDNLIICIGNNNRICCNDNTVILAGQNTEVRGANDIISFDTRAQIYSC